MKPAKELKRVITGEAAMSQRIAIYKAKDLMDKAIEEAVSNGQSYVDVTMPETMSDAVVEALCKTLSKLGYTTSVDQTSGYIGRNLVRMPRTILTIGWK